MKDKPKTSCTANPLWMTKPILMNTTLTQLQQIKAVFFK